MNVENAHLLRLLLTSIIKRQVKPDVLQWLEEKGSQVNKGNNKSALNAAFAAVPRKTGHQVVEVSADELAQVSRLSEEFSIRNWPIDKLCRLWLLLQFDSSDETGYHTKLEGLFRDAEMNELIALYASLPVFNYPESWQLRTAEGIRSNIGPVLEAIMYDNPYPYRYLPEPSWNQLVLKAFFTEKDVNRIIGLDERSNKALSAILVDYAHERQAAHRPVNPQLWRLVSKFIDENNIKDIERLFQDGQITEKRAAVLACAESDYAPAKRLLEKEPSIYAAVNANKINWSSL